MTLQNKARMQTGKEQGFFMPTGNHPVGFAPSSRKTIPVGISLKPTFSHSLRMTIFPTPEEKYFKDNFESHCVYKRFEFQKPIKTEITTYIVDFCIEKFKIIIEIDGLSHLSKLDYDIKRDHQLELLGYTVIHFNNKEVMKYTKGVNIMEIRYNVHYPFGDNYPPGMSEMNYRYVGELPAYYCKRCNRWLWQPCKNCKNPKECFCDGVYKVRFKKRGGDERIL